MRSWSLIPGDTSTPDDTSMPYGCTRLTASRTLSGVSPPARMISRCRAKSEATAQSMTLPVPPLLSGSWTSSNTFTSPGQWLRTGATSPPTANALTTGRVIDCAYCTSSDPCNCTALRLTRSAMAFTSSTGWSTNTPIAETAGGSVDRIRDATSMSTHRGLFGQNTKPIACAPQATAACASSTRVMPQIFTNVTDT